MRCEACGSEMRLLEGQTYRYVESGLHNVILSNITVRECAGCEARSPLIPAMTRLHKAMAEAIAAKPAPLTGAELRFLRKQLGFSAKAWAKLMDVDPATVSRWEGGKQEIGPQSDKLARLLFVRGAEERAHRLLEAPVFERVRSLDYQERPENEWLVEASEPPEVRYRPPAA